MNPLLVGLLVFACTFGGAFAGISLHRRLPQHHRESDSRDVVKLVLGLIGTMSALVLSLLIATAHTAYVTQESEVQTLGVRIVQLDRVFATYGPEAADARRMFRELVAARVAQVWPGRAGAGARDVVPHVTRERDEALIERVANLSPFTDSQRFAKTRALQLLTDIAEARQLLYAQAGGAIPWPFLVVLVFWLVVLFTGFGFLVHTNGTVRVALFVGSLSVAAAIFLVLDMSQPLSGLMHISNEPIRLALDAISR